MKKHFSSYLFCSFLSCSGKELLLLPEQFLFRDPQVLQPHALPASLGGDVLALAQDLLAVLAEVAVAQAVKG